MPPRGKYTAADLQNADSTAKRYSQFDVDTQQPSTASPQTGPTVSARDNSQPVANWLEDLGSDLRYGSGLTLPGRIARMIMPHGMTAGKSSAVTEMLGGPVLGPIKMAHGWDVMPWQPNHGLAEMIRGSGQTMSLPMAVIAPEATAMSAPSMAVGTGVSAGAKKLGASDDVADILGTIAGIGTPEAGRGVRMGTRAAGKVMEKNAPQVAEFATHPVSSTVRPLVRGGIRTAGKILQRMAGPETTETPAAVPKMQAEQTPESKAAISQILKEGDSSSRWPTITGGGPNWAAQSKQGSTNVLGEIPPGGQRMKLPGKAPSDPAASLTPESKTALADESSSQHGLTAESQKELADLRATKPEKRPLGMVEAGKGPNWEEFANARRENFNEMESRAEQKRTAGEGVQLAEPTAEEQAWTDAMAGFGEPTDIVPKMAEPEPPQALGKMSKYYGKTAGKSNLKRNQRQIYGPTSSTAPNPAVPKTAPHPPEIMRILQTPGDIPAGDWEKLQQYFADQRAAAAR